MCVCIPNWNCRDLLRACLSSLRDNFQGVRFEIIVVDNASTDGAADMVAQAFPDVLLVRNPQNRGFAAACNQAARAARGRFLFFLNNDTIVPAGTLRRLLDYAEAHPRVGMIGPRLIGSDGRTQGSCRARPTLWTFLHRAVLFRWTGLLKSSYKHYRRQASDPGIEPRKVETLMGAAVWLSRRVLFACGGWDEDYAFGGEDLDLSLRVGRNFDVVYLPEAAVVHYGRVSTRANVGYSAPRVAIGFARYLRKSGTSFLGLAFYKLMVSIDTPLLLSLHGVQFGWRSCLGQWQKAEQSRQRLKEGWAFLTNGFVDFWRV